MLKHIGILSMYMKNSIMSQLEYRANFIASFIFELACFLTKLTYAFVVISTQMSAGDLDTNHIVIFIGIYTIMTGLFCFIAPSVMSFSNKVYSGELDYLLVKPASAVLLGSLSNQDFGSCASNVVAGLTLIIFGFVKSNTLPKIHEVLLGFFFIIIGIIISYLLFMIPQLLSFWVLKIDKMYMTIWSLWDFNNLPMTVYPKSVWWVGIFLVPIFIITNTAGFALTGKLEAWFTFATIGMAIVLYCLFNILYIKGLKRYHSSNMS